MNSCILIPVVFLAFVRSWSSSSDWRLLGSRKSNWTKGLLWWRKEGCRNHVLCIPETGCTLFSVFLLDGLKSIGLDLDSVDLYVAIQKMNCPSPLLSEYMRYNRKLNITFNFRFHMYEFFLKSVISHALGPPPPVTNCHTFSNPLERDVLFGRPLYCMYVLCPDSTCGFGWKESWHPSLDFRQLWAFVEIPHVGVRESGCVFSWLLRLVPSRRVYGFYLT